MAPEHLHEPRIKSEKIIVVVIANVVTLISFRHSAQQSINRTEIKKIVHYTNFLR
jgi:hypothetical protein